MKREKSVLFQAPFLKVLKTRSVVGDGAMGSLLYSRGIYINRSYDAISLETPQLVKQIHRDYLEAGAQLIQTNTYGANETGLAQFGLSDQVEAINQAAAKLAREAAEESQQSRSSKIWIAGNLGPLSKKTAPFGPLSAAESIQKYKRQVSSLLSAGVDLFIIETLDHLSQLRAAVECIREETTKPIVGCVAVDEDGCTLEKLSWDRLQDRLENLELDVYGINCSSGPAIVLEMLQAFRPRAHKYLAAIPNAGLPREIHGRTLHMATPEYFGSFANKFANLGVHLIGGCCGTTPAHIQRVHNALKAFASPPKELKLQNDYQKSIPSQVQVFEKPKSRLHRGIKANRLVTSVEIDPPKGLKLDKVINAARLCHDAGVDCINIADGPRASARMNPASMAVQLEREVGIETIIHYCCRDRNLLGMQMDLLGAHSLGLRNVLCITGDPPKLGNYPDATAVFDVDAVGLTQIVKNLNEGYDLAGKSVGAKCSFFQGVGCNPGALDFEKEMNRLQQKIDAGAEYVLTQPVYENKTFERFLAAYNRFSYQPPLLIGICPLASLRNAQFLHNEVPGMQIPPSIMKRMEKLGSSEAQRSEGIKIAREALHSFQTDIQGAYIMPPFNRAETALAVLDGFIQKEAKNTKRKEKT